MGVDFTGVRPGGSWVHPWLLGSLQCTLVIVRGRWVHYSAPWVWLGSSGVAEFTRVRSLRSSWVVGFTRVRRSCRWIHPCSLGSLFFVLGVIGFIRGLWVHSGSPCGSLGSSVVVGFIRVRPSDSWGARWGSLSTSGVVRFIRVRPWGRCVHSGSLSTLRFALGVVGYIRDRLFHEGSP